MGVLLYVLVCGGLPFDGSSFQELFTKIVNCQYYVPDYVSPDCRDLIGRMLVVDPKQRATIDQIREHRWVLEDGAPVAKFSGMPFTMPTTLDDIDMSLVAEMEHVGYEQEHVIRAILSETYDEAAATYFLLKAKRHKEDEVRLARHKSQEVSHKVKRYDRPHKMSHDLQELTLVVFF
jgi:MAP/microtubule affinity-regulating kinase